MGIFRFFKNRRDDSSESCFGERSSEKISFETGKAAVDRSQKGEIVGTETVRRDEGRAFFEKDNQGTRVMRHSQAEILWEEVEAGSDSTTYIAYVFDREIDASEALLSLSFIYLATDTGNPVCSREYVFGCYRRADGKFETVIAGREMPLEHWTEAKKKFSFAGGACYKERKPGNGKKPNSEKKIRQVVFVREYSRIDLTEKTFIKVYNAPDAITARSFLNDPGQRISQKNYMVLVQSPEGDFYRDFFGVHEGRG